MTRAPHHRKTKEPGCAVGSAADRQHGPDAGRSAGVRAAERRPRTRRNSVVPHPSDERGLCEDRLPQCGAQAQSPALPGAARPAGAAAHAGAGVRTQRRRNRQADRIVRTARLSFGRRHRIGERAGERRTSSPTRWLRTSTTRSPRTGPSSSFTSATSSIISASGSITMISFTSPIAITQRRSWRSPATTTAWSLRA